MKEKIKEIIYGISQKGGMCEEIEDGQIIGLKTGKGLELDQVAEAIANLKICHCENVDFGSYSNQVLMRTPLGELVGIDTCIATEIGYLWHQGVETLNSCCGHGKLLSTVVVAKESVERMKDLGYKNWGEKEVANPEQTFSLAR